MKPKIRLPILILISVSLLMASVMAALSPEVQITWAEDTILSAYPAWYFPVSEFYPNFQSGTELGSAVSGAGDFNGDGIADIIFSAQKYEVNVYREGAVFAFQGNLGSEGLSTVPTWVMGGGQQGSLFGCELSALGDINNDGFDDIVVGACDYNDFIDEDTIPKVGAAFVFLGPLNNLKINPDWSLIGHQVEARLGSALGSGNFNGDAYTDLLVGAPFYDDSGFNNNGKVFLFFGPLDPLDQTPDWTASGSSNSAIFGSALDNAGDVNGDGLEDIIVGAPQPGSTQNPQVGHVYIYHNHETTGFGSSPDQMLTNGQEFGKFGAAVAGVGDVNNDGFDDVLVGSPGAVNFDLDIVTGCVYLYAGSKDGIISTPVWQKCGEQENGQFGASVAAAGFMNDDSRADFLVGMPFYSVSNEKMGAVFLFFGDLKPNYVKEEIESTYGNKADTQFGFSVSGAGDVNQDGRLDVIVGAPTFKVNNQRFGRAMVYYAGIPGLPYPEDIFSFYLPLVQTGN